MTAVFIPEILHIDKSPMTFAVIPAFVIGLLRVRSGISVDAIPNGNEHYLKGRSGVAFSAMIC